MQPGEEEGDTSREDGEEFRYDSLDQGEFALWGPGGREGGRHQAHRGGSRVFSAFDRGHPWMGCLRGPALGMSLLLRCPGRDSRAMYVLSNSVLANLHFTNTACLGLQVPVD